MNPFDVHTGHFGNAGWIQVLFGDAPRVVHEVRPLRRPKCAADGHCGARSCQGVDETLGMWPEVVCEGRRFAAIRILVRPGRPAKYFVRGSRSNSNLRHRIRRGIRGNGCDQCFFSHVLPQQVHMQLLLTGRTHAHCFPIRIGDTRVRFSGSGNDFVFGSRKGLASGEVG